MSKYMTDCQHHLTQVKSSFTRLRWLALATIFYICHLGSSTTISSMTSTTSETTLPQVGIDFSLSVISMNWMRGTIDGKPVDILIKTSISKTWSEANDHCNSLGGHLLYIENGISVLENAGQPDRLVDFIYRTYEGQFGKFWDGMHVDNGELKWNKFGIPENVGETAGGLIEDWVWSPDWPYDGSDMCGAIDVIYNGNDLFTMGLLPCGQRLPYICYREVANLVEEEYNCGRGWLGSPFVDACFKVDLTPMSQDMATSTCAKYDATVIHSVDFNFIDYTEMLIDARFWTFYNGICGISAGKSSLPQKCPSLFQQQKTNFPVICERPYIRTARSIVFDESGIEENIKVPLNKQFSMITVNITCRFKVPNADLCWDLLWVQDGQSVALLSDKISTKDGIIIMEQRDGYYYSTYRSFYSRFERRSWTGQYWCEVITCRPYHRYASKTYTVQFQGLFTFAGSVSLVNGFITDDYIKYNYIGNRISSSSEMSALDQYIINGIDVTTNKLSSSLNVENFGISFRKNQFSGTNGTRLHFTLTINLMDIFIYMSWESWFGEEEIIRWFTAFLVSTIEENETIIPFGMKRLAISWPQFDPTSVEIRSTGICYTTVIPLSDDTTLYFPSVRGGYVAKSLELCYADDNDIPYATMTCSGNYNTGYQLIDIRIMKGCEDIFDSTSNVTDDLFKILQRPIVRNNVESVVDVLSNITRVPKVLRSRDVVHLGVILSEVSKVNNIPGGVDEGFIDTVNNVLSVDEAQIRIAQTGDHSANRIIKSVEKFAERQEINPSGEQKQVRPHIAMTSLRLKDAVNLVVGHFSKALNNMVSQWSPASVLNIYNTSDFSVSNTRAAIILPESLVREQIQASGETKLTFIIFQDGRLFRAARGHNYESKVSGILNSFIVSAKIDGRRIQGLTEKIKTVFLPINESADENSTVCAYWDINWDEGNGGWSTEGCSFLKKEDGRLVCACDHLTYFAVLLDFYGQDDPHAEIHVTVLEYITIIGLSLSIAGLGLTILSFILFKALRRGRGQQTLFCLSLSLLCTYIVFLAGINRTENYGGCIAVAVLLHYFLLASFMWMLMEAVLQYLRFVKVLGTYVPKYMIKSSIPAWGVPLIPVIVVLAIDYDLYKGGDNYCWMSLTALYYAFLVPVAVIIVVNAVLYFIITLKLCCQRNDGLRSNQSKRKANILRTQASLACLLLMGLTWAFGYLAIEEGRLAFTYIFTILNSLQGFFIFLMFTLREKKVREYWKKLCCKCMRTKEKGQKYRSTTPTSKGPNDNLFNSNYTTENTKSTSASFDNKTYLYNKI